MQKSFRAKHGVQFHHPLAFWLGTAAVISGVVAHLPMFISSAPMRFQMVGMAMSPVMMIGMYAIVAGTLLVAYGLIPGSSSRVVRPVGSHARTTIRALDEAPLSAVHWKLFTVLTIALVVDVMKPATLGFVIPGASEEYGLSKSQAALMPFFGILGTAIGSLLWGYLGDTIGRRASILLAAMIFIGSSICGAMPSYSWNVFMCFMMGLGAGGMLPITFALLTELAPAKQRGWLVVLIGGIGTVGGYLAASGLATLLEPYFGWRIMWLIGAPTGVLLIVLNRYMPESPRWLLANGINDEANRIIRAFGRNVKQSSESAIESVHVASKIEDAKPGNFLELFHKRFAGVSTGLSLYAVTWGLINFGFLLWLPMNLRAIGMGVEASDAILAKSTIIALPSVAIAAWLYHSWSSKKSLAVYALVASLALLGIATQGVAIAQNEYLLMLLLVALIAGSSGMIAMLSPYAAEVYPSHIRSSGSGWAAGCSKGIGVVTLGSVVAAGFIPGIAVGALVIAVPTLASAMFIGWKGIETRGLSLEKIQDVTVQAQKA